MPQPTINAGLAPLTAEDVLLTPRERALVEQLGRRAAARARMAERAYRDGKDMLSETLAAESKAWRQAAQLVREALSAVDIDLRDPTVFALLEKR